MMLSGNICSVFVIFFFKQKTAYEMRISDWSSDVCSSDLIEEQGRILRTVLDVLVRAPRSDHFRYFRIIWIAVIQRRPHGDGIAHARQRIGDRHLRDGRPEQVRTLHRSEEHTSELQSLMRISYAVFCLKTKTKTKNNNKAYLKA